MTAVSLDDRIKVSADAVCKELGGEAVVLDLASGMYFGLDETSTRLWQLLQDRSTLRAACERLREEFDVEPARVEQDAIDFVRQLADAGLVTIVPSSQA